MGLGDEVSIRRAAAITGVTRKTIGRWITARRLKARVTRRGDILVKLVKLKDVQELAAAIRRGRKPGDGRRG
jgi:predicted site-specific integrase-resolvase